MFKIGLSTKGKVLNEELFRQYSLAGIQAMELALSQNELEALDFCELKAISDKYSVEIASVHLPCGKCDVSKAEAYDYTLTVFEDIIKRASSVGIRRFVVHPSTEPIADEERMQRLFSAKNCLSELADIADGYNSVIAVEVLPRTCLGKNSQEILELISLNDKLMVCFDTNHLLKEDSTDFIRNVGKRIVTTHISDYNFIDEQHWMPGVGKINWDKLIDTLLEVGYNGPWMYEVAFYESGRLGRRIVCSDFVDNANSILAPHFDDGERNV